MPTPSWPATWLRGVLDLCVLRVLLDGPTYGYAVTVRLEELGLGTVKGGTLYPLLGRLEEQGLVTSRWEPGDGGPGRKYFELTDEGRRHAHERAAAWTRFTEVTRAALDTESTHSSRSRQTTTTPEGAGR